MSQKTIQLPGFGFCILVASYLSLGALLYYGSQTPRLDEVFDILSKRERPGFSSFSADEVRLLEGTLRDYGGFSRALLGKSQAKFLEPRQEGWIRRAEAHLVVKPEKDGPLELQVEADGKPADFPLQVTLEGKGLTKTLELNYDKPTALDIAPSDLKGTSILSVKTKGAKDIAASVPSWGIRVVPRTNSPNRDPHD